MFLGRGTLHGACGDFSRNICSVFVLLRGDVSFVAR